MGDRPRTPRAMGQLTVGKHQDLDQGVGTTIVGGQPPGGGRKLARVPVGMERVLYAAAVDAVFRGALMADRQQAVQSRGFALTPSEQAMLKAIPEAQLAASIDGMDTSAENVERRSFLQVVAASAVTVAAGEVVAGCSDDDDKDAGKKVDMGPDTGPATDGIRPDLGPDTGPAVQGIRPGLDSAGISPDLPQPRDAMIVPEVASYGIRPKG